MVPNRLRRTPEVEDDYLTFGAFNSLMINFEDKWNDIINALIQYHNGMRTFDDTIPAIKRQLSILGQEMDRASTRVVLNDAIAYRLRDNEGMPLFKQDGLNG